MYQLLRSLLFLTPPEWAHYFSMNSLKLFCNLGFKGLIKKIYAPKSSVATSFCNLSFSNKVGLGAGFDKNAKYLNELEAMGFEKEFIARVNKMIYRNQFKRLPPLIAKIMNRTVNIDFRYNRDWMT